LNQAAGGSVERGTERRFLYLFVVTDLHRPLPHLSLWTRMYSSNSHPEILLWLSCSCEEMIGDAETVSAFRMVCPSVHHSQTPDGLLRRIELPAIDSTPRRPDSHARQINMSFTG
jgi:hypothetical protein